MTELKKDSSPKYELRVEYLPGIDLPLPTRVTQPSEPILPKLPMPESGEVTDHPKSNISQAVPITFSDRGEADLQEAPITKSELAREGLFALGAMTLMAAGIWWGSEAIVRGEVGWGLCTLAITLPLTIDRVLVYFAKRYTFRYQNASKDLD